MDKTAKGKELVFISRIKRDGSGVESITDQGPMDRLDETNFSLQCLSITERTWIASEFASYVVKLKKDNQ